MMDFDDAVELAMEVDSYAFAYVTVIKKYNGRWMLEVDLALPEHPPEHFLPGATLQYHDDWDVVRSHYGFPKSKPQERRNWRIELEDGSRLDYLDYINREANHAPQRPRRFVLFRFEDISGISGTGIVASGCVFPDERVVLAWHSEHASTTVFRSIDDLLAIHGHRGASDIVWIDEEYR